jgi:hypothetical protein
VDYPGSTETGVFIELSRAASSIVEFIADSDGNLIGVKRGLNPARRIEREITVQDELNHPRTINAREPVPEVHNGDPILVAEFVWNGSLADHLADAENSDLCLLQGPT